MSTIDRIREHPSVPSICSQADSLLRVRSSRAFRRDGDGEIYVMDVDGGKRQQLTDNSVEDEFPVWRPAIVEIVQPPWRRTSGRRSLSRTSNWIFVG